LYILIFQQPLTQRCFAQRGLYYKVKVKVKCTLIQALRLCTGRTAHRGSRGTALPFLTTALEGGKGSASRPGRSLPPGKTRYPLYRRLGRPHERSRQVRKISPPTGIRSLDHPARSQLLYRLRYSAHLYYKPVKINIAETIAVS
jgi:hypothetical protein